MKTDEVEDGKLRLRESVTAGAQETEGAVIVRGLLALLCACPDSHQPLRLRIRFERDSRGRESSRRLFLTLIAEPRRNSGRLW